MAQVNKIDSNSTGLSYAVESSIGVLPGTPVWIPLEPNEYSDFGGNNTLTPRRPIDPSRQRKKGVITDLDASGGYGTDLTQSNLQELLECFFFASLRRKTEAKNATGVTTNTFSMTASSYTITRVGGSIDMSNFAAGILVLVSGFSTSANNGLFRVDSSTTTTIVLTTADGTEANPSGLVDEAASSNVSVVAVGVEATDGDLDVVVSGSLPVITSTTLDFTTLGLIPGEFIYIGGDESENQYTNSENNGFKRVRSVSANALTLDKSDSAMVAEADDDQSIHIYFGRVLKNETGSSIVRQTVQLERQLGAPDDSSPSQIQAEYLPGCVANEFTLNIPSADKITANLAFVALNNEQRLGAAGVKSGTRATIPDEDMFNTSSDFSRINISQVVAGEESPTPLFAFAQALTININNNVSPNKAVGTLGAFDMTAGSFDVSGSITAYFSNVSAVQAVTNNSDISLDMAMVKDNAGIVLDLPLIALGDGRPNVSQDEPVTLPLNMDAATASKIDTSLNHTAMMVFFDYLPTEAE